MKAKTLKNEGRSARAAQAGAAAEQSASHLWYYAGAFLAALFCAFQVYSPALHGPFAFDDLHLPFTQPGAIDWPLTQWLGVRPLLMSTYWFNLHQSGGDPYAYHVFNILFHVTATALLFLAVRKILELAGLEKKRIPLLAAFAAGVFLLHPVQTEAVAYIASRSENLSAVFFFGAFCLFLYRRSLSASWGVSLGVLALFLLAITTKEHTLTLPALLLLTDYYWNPGFSFEGVRKNWRIYLPMVIGGLLGAAFVIRYLLRDTTSVGFQMKEFTWYQYLFTQFRVFFTYLQLFLLPIGQTLDWDLPVSRTFFDHGAFLAFAAVAVWIAAAIHYRRKFPLSSYGFLVFVLLLLPTSSFIPLKDVIAERRMYLPMVGLLLIAIDWFRRWDVRQHVLAGVFAAILLVLGICSYNRSEVWQSTLNLWTDAAEKSPGKQRTQFGLGVAYFQAGRCKDAIDRYARAAQLEKPDFSLLLNWGLAYDCNHQPREAEQKLRASVAAKPTAEAYTSLAVVEAKQGKYEEPLKDLLRAEEINSLYPMIYIYRAEIYLASNQPQLAANDYRHCLIVDPNNQLAKDGLAKIERQLSGQR